MTPIDRFERHLPGALTELAEPRTPDYFTDILGLTARTRQRPAWASLGRWLPMDVTTQRVPVFGVPWRRVGLLAVLALLLLVALAVAVGSQAPVSPAPAFGPAANGPISYAEDGDLFVGDPVTGESRLVLGGDTTDIEPAFSRDGTRLAFLRLIDPDNADVFRIMVMDADGSNVNVVTPDPIASPNWWDWTPTGDLIVAAPTTTPVNDITIYDADGVDPPKTLTQGIDVNGPVFRPPDSREIMFGGRVGDQVGVFVMNADGSDQRPLIPLAATGNPDFSLQEPRFSPDGSRIAYHRWDDATQTMRLYVADADGTDPRELGARDDIWFTGWPVWSNDGTRIAATHVPRGANLPGALVVIDVATDEITRTGPDSNDSRFEWAPDDSKILMSRNDGSIQFLLDPDGGPVIELPWDAGSYPSWQRLAPTD